MANFWNIYGYTPKGPDEDAVYVVNIYNAEEEDIALHLAPAEFDKFIKACQLVRKDWHNDVESLID
jgi:hypothetical protein